MATPNYSFQKRQRELAKKQKKEEKRLRKAGAAESAPEDTAAGALTPPAPEEIKPAD